jgi:alkanesulfonate monooxygenase SsuD/methylene tetrahydromethanopterin reductase-like flavin-dependent oxidoreductase (luciferase family)
MVLGLGAGWQINEHHAYGIDLEPPGQRVSRFSEAIGIVRSLLAEDSTTFHGEFYNLIDAPCDPKPVQSPLPLLVGTRGPRMLRIAARHATEWNTWSAPDLADARASLREACEAVGRDPATMWTSVNALVDLDARTPAPGRPSLAGSAQQLADQLGRHADLGFDEFNLADWNLGEGRAERSDNLARIKAEVLDQLT